MARKVNHKHSKIRDLKVIQYISENDERSKVINNGESFELETSVNGAYYLEFQIPGNRYCTINFAKTYGVEKFTRKKDENNPQNDRVIFKVTNLAGPFDRSSKVADDDIEVKDPDDQPIGKVI